MFGSLQHFHQIL